MNKKAILLLAAFALFLQSAGASTVTRSLSSTTVQTGSDLNVRLIVDVTGTETYYAIDETTPNGWTVKSPGGGDRNQAGHIKWLVYQNAADTNYNYVLTAPGQAGTATFSGIYMFEGMGSEAQIAGQTQASVVSGSGCTTSGDCNAGKICCNSTCTTSACTADANCNDLNAATADTCTAPGTCTSACLHTTITQCTNGDGYCPPGCTSGTDNDCLATCGNGTIDANENCANCPADASCTGGNICCNSSCIAPACTANSQCADTDSCTADSCNSPNTCTASCTHTKIPGCSASPGGSPGGGSGGSGTEGLVVNVQGNCAGQPITVEVRNEQGVPVPGAEVTILKDRKLLETKTTDSNGKIILTLQGTGEYVFNAAAPAYNTSSKSRTLTSCQQASPPTVSFQKNIETGKTQVITLAAGDGTPITDFNVLIEFPDRTAATLATTNGLVSLLIGEAGTYTATVRAADYETTVSFEAKKPYQVMPNINPEAKPTVGAVFGKETAEEPNYLIIWLLAIAVTSGLIVMVTKLRPVWFRVFIAATYTTLPLVVNYYAKNTWLAFATIGIQTTVLTAIWFRQCGIKKAAERAKNGLDDLGLRWV